MNEKEVMCEMCGDYFDLPIPEDDDWDGCSIHGICPHCGSIDDHECTEES